MNWRSHQWYANVNVQWEGANNSLNEPGFDVFGATLRGPFAEGLTWQVSGDNLGNKYGNLWPAFGSGVFIPLANGQLAATQAGVLPARTYRFVITKTFGQGSNANP